MANTANAITMDLIATFASSPDVVFRLDADGQCLWVAPSIEGFLHTPASKLIGRNVHHLFPRDTAELMVRTVRQALHENRVLPSDYEVLDNGEQSSFTARIFPVSPDSAIWMARNVTAERQSERQLRQELQWRRAITAGLADGVCTTDRYGHLVSMNPAAERMLGRSEADTVGFSFCETICAPRPKEAAEGTEPCGLARAIADNAIVKVDDGLFQRLDGTNFPVSYTASCLCGLGDTQGALVVFRDMTERRELEANLRHAQKMESIGQLVAGVAHDFNNLLTVINGHTSIMLAKEDCGGSIRRGLNEIRHAGERAAQVTHRLLASSRRQLLQSCAVNINSLVSGLQPILRRVIQEDIRIEFNLDAGVNEVKADPDQLEQLIISLSMNARDAMPNGGTLVFSTRLEQLSAEFTSLHKLLQPGRYVKLVISDTGCGMTAQVRERIFEPYFTTKERGKGTGLGLAMAYGFVRQIGGDISVESIVNTGTAFSIFIPVAEPAPLPASLPAAVHAVRQGNETVLLVEDDEAVREYTAEILRLGGYRVLLASDGPDAVHCAMRFDGKIDLLLSDVVMPGANGPPVAAMLCQTRKTMRVLFMSGHSDQALFDDHAVSRESALLAKPFTMRALLLRVREELDRPMLGGTIVIADDQSAIRSLVRTALEPCNYTMIDAANGFEVLEICRSTAVDLLITDLAMPEKDGLETIQQLHTEFPEIPVLAMSGLFWAEDMLNAARYLGAQSVVRKPLDLDALPSIVSAAMHYA